MQNFIIAWTSKTELNSFLIIIKIKR